jgi:hypothetical protein
MRRQISSGMATAGRARPGFSCRPRLGIFGTLDPYDAPVGPTPAGALFLVC